MLGICRIKNVPFDRMEVPEDLELGIHGSVGDFNVVKEHNAGKANLALHKTFYEVKRNAKRAPG